MPEPKWRTPRPTEVVATLEEINRYRQALGLSPLKSLLDLTEIRPEQELARLKRQWGQKVGGVGGWISQLPRGITAGWYQPSWSPATQGGSTAPALPSTPPTPPPTGEPSYQWYVPGQVILDPNTGKFYATGGEWQMPSPGEILASGYGEINPGEATQMRTEYDRGAFERGQPQRNWQMDFALLQSREAEKERAWTSAQQRFAAKDVGLQSQNRELQRQVNEMQFERDRERLLSGIPGNDWITQYTLQNQPNPYKKQEISPIDQLEANLDSITGTIQKYETEAVLAANAEAAGERYHITSAEANEVVASNKERRDALYNTWKTVQDESVGWSPQPVPQPYPATPDWLPQYAPGLKAGQMITRQNVPTPSGQQLTAMSRDQLEQLGYFGKWTGQLGGKYPWETLTESAALMQPRSPGFGRARWKPVGLV